MDTRTTHSPLTAHENYAVNVVSYCRYSGVCTSNTEDEAAVVDNLTVTQPTKNGVLTVSTGTS